VSLVVQLVDPAEQDEVDLGKERQAAGKDAVEDLVGDNTAAAVAVDNNSVAEVFVAGRYKVDSLVDQGTEQGAEHSYQHSLVVLDSNNS